MREIKFRAWDKVSGRIFCSANQSGVRSIDFSQTGEPESIYLFEYLEDGNFSFTRRDVDEVVLSQYTCLKDKNCVEIYDGDIVKVTDDYMEDTLHEIKWFGEDYYPAFDLHPNIDVESNGLSYIFTGIGCDTIEVIGNIYENKELLYENNI